ncbi:Aste57867_1317 [Aphanomyces stellatus]|uniref:Aste57867_1317 protein n=1 Tax=Aphanomyces stellatus TaxID=120398 RepID=A0A485K5Z5_9STRA|nr:hypothetical protein As57867_001316 [Aphanomyces stellatus]VFT78536.1 Aste57867_1317 [Aphanomyces stellatus]
MPRRIRGDAHAFLHTSVISRSVPKLRRPVDSMLVRSPENVRQRTNTTVILFHPDDLLAPPSHEGLPGRKTSDDYVTMLDVDTCIQDDTDILFNEYVLDGALRPGGALSLGSTEALSLLAQYAGVGLMFGVFDALSYPVFQNYLHMEGYQTQSYRVLMGMGWISKIFFGFVSDCFPLFGYHRRPYMILGWLICGAMCLVMAITPFPSPYYGRAGLAGTPLANLSTADRRFINDTAADHGTTFVLCTMVASMGYVMADCASDALLVDYAQREPVAIRGRIQTAAYLTRESFFALPMVLVGLCMNDYKYGGHFSWSVGPNVVYGVFVLPCAVAAYVASIWLVEKHIDGRKRVRDYVHDLWLLLQQSLVTRLCAFLFFQTLCFNYTSTVNMPIEKLFAKVQPLTDTLFYVVYQIVRVLTMLCVGRFMLEWPWRPTLAGGTLLLLLLDGTMLYATTWGVVRNEVFYRGLGALEGIPSALVLLFGGYAIVEVAGSGNEGLVFALLTSCSNIGMPLGVVLSKSIDAHFAVSLDDLARDDDSVKWQVTYALACASAVKALSMAFLFLLPPQKATVQLLKQRGHVNQTAAILVLTLFSIFYVLNLVGAILAVNPSTWCLRIAGGKGC